MSIHLYYCDLLKSIAATCLLYHDIDFVTIFHFQGLWCVVVFNALSIENEATLVIRKTLSLAVGIHEFF